MPFLATFIVLSIVGIADAGYLMYAHQKKKPLVCPLEHDCSRVTESRWSYVLGVRNELLGLIFYMGILLFALGEVIFPALLQPFYDLAVLGIGAGLIFSIILLLIEIFYIKDYCFYCVISALLTLLLFINVFFIPH